MTEVGKFHNVNFNSLLLIPESSGSSFNKNNETFFSQLHIYSFIVLFLFHYIDNSTFIFCENSTIKLQLKQLNRNLMNHSIFALR